MIVRPAEPADWPGLWPLLAGMGQVDAAEAARRRFASIVADAAQYLAVAELGGELVGYAWAHQGPRHLRAGHSTVRLNDLFVAPGRRRQGAGRRLLAAVIAWATGRGATWLEWQAGAAALPFYARLGYTGDPCPDPAHPYFELTLAADPRR